MLYQLLTVVLPFRGESMSELMFKIANQEAADIRVLRPDIVQALADVVVRALSKRPETRYQSGAQFAADLREVAVQWSLGGDGRQAESPMGAQKTVAFAAAVPLQASGRSAGTSDIEIQSYE